VTTFVVIATTISTVAAAGALYFAWRTVGDARAARREDERARRLDRLAHLLELVGDVAVAAKAQEWTHEFAVAQLRLGAAVRLFPDLKLTSCDELADAEAEEAFDVYLEARDELQAAIERHLAG
jgi:hypothetical protein